MNIEFGCGQFPMNEDFLTSDCRDLPGIDFVCNVWDIEKHVEPNTVDHVYSRHMFEHLTFAQGSRTLDAWNSILKKDGICEIIVPNMTFHIKQWLYQRDDPEEFQHALGGLWGWQMDAPLWEGKCDVTSDEELEKIWDVHKSGYDLKLLRELLTNKGFKDIISLEPVTSWHLHVKAIKG